MVRSVHSEKTDNQIIPASSTGSAMYALWQGAMKGGGVNRGLSQTSVCLPSPASPVTHNNRLRDHPDDENIKCLEC